MSLKDKLAFVKETTWESKPNKEIKTFRNTLNYAIQSQMHIEQIREIVLVNFTHECACGTNVGSLIIQVGLTMISGQSRFGVLCCNPECNRTFTILKD